MFDELDKFLESDTWHTTHPNDTMRFMKVLHGFVKDPGFNPESMREHMKSKLGISVDDPDPYFRNAVDRYVTAAWSVKEYLEANHLRLMPAGSTHTLPEC